MYNLPILSRSAVQGFIDRSECVRTRRRQKKKSGREDPACNWAVCRLAQAIQWREQFRIGCLEPNHEDRLLSKFPPLFLDAIAFWDEHHRQIILGNANIHQHLVARNENGVFTSPELGGVFQPVSDITSVFDMVTVLKP